MHNHPRNAERVAAGKVPVNSLWFWGGGVLPDSVTCRAECVISEDDELLALARRAGASLVRSGDVAASWSIFVGSAIGRRSSETILALRWQA